MVNFAEDIRPHFERGYLCYMYKCFNDLKPNNIYLKMMLPKKGGKYIIHKYTGNLDFGHNKYGLYISRGKVYKSKKDFFEFLHFIRTHELEKIVKFKGTGTVYHRNEHIQAIIYPRKKKNKEPKIIKFDDNSPTMSWVDHNFEMQIIYRYKNKKE